MIRQHEIVVSFHVFFRKKMKLPLKSHGPLLDGGTLATPRPTTPPTMPILQSGDGDHGASAYRLPLLTPSVARDPVVAAHPLPSA